MSQSGVGATQLGRHVRVHHREALDVQLVEDDLVPLPPQRMVVTPVEPWVGDDGPWHERGAVGRGQFPVVAAEAVPVDGWIPSDLTVDRRGVRVEEQLGRVAPQAVRRVVGTVDAVSVALAGSDPWDEAVPHEAVDLVIGMRSSPRDRSNRHSSTRWATSENSAKLVPIPS